MDLKKKQPDEPNQQIKNTGEKTIQKANPLSEEEVVHLKSENEHLKQALEDHKQSLNRLKNDQDLFELAFELTSDFMYSIKQFADHYHLMEWGTKKFSDITGYTQPELTAMGGLGVIVLPDTIDVYHQRMADIRSGRANVSDLHIETRSGDDRWVTLHTKPLLYDDKEIQGYYLVVGRDITEQKRREQTVRESEIRHRLISELSSDFNYSTHLLPDGTHTHGWDGLPALSSITGYTESEIKEIGHFRSFLHPDSLEQHERYKKDIRAGKSHRGEFRLQAKDGTDRWIYMVSSPLWYDEETHSGENISVGWDITERTRIEEILRKSEEKYRLLAEHVTDVIWTMNLNRELTYISPSADRVWGPVISDENATESIDDFIAPSSIETASSVFLEELIIEADLVSKGLQKKDLTRPRTFELELVRRDGSTYWTENITDFIRDDNGTPIGILGVTRDIDERKKTENELKKSEERFRALIENALEGIIVVDTKGNILYQSPTMMRVLDYSIGEVIGHNTADFIHPDDLPEALNLFTMLAQKPDETISTHIRAKHKDGSYRIIEGVGRNLINNPSINGIVINYRDITEKIKFEEHRQKLETQLQRAQKMEAIGALAGGVAHDLNNILSGIVSYPELLLLDLPNDSHLRKPLLTIKDTGEKATAIVQDLLTLARRGVVVSEVVNLNNIVSDYLGSPEYMRLRSFHPHVDINIELDRNLFTIIGSPVHLFKTVMNLVSNAVEAVSGSGEVTISTANRYVDTPMKGYESVKEGEYVTLIIADNGIGIAQKDIEKIFEPFYSKKVMGKSGTGLGMAVVWGTVKDHRGYIDVASEEQKGSIVTLYFPANREQLPVNQNQPALGEYTGNGESILVIDDVKIQREIASDILSRLGYAVNSVASGEAAIEYLKRKSADLLILDMIMNPGMDGLETYKHITEHHPKQKVIIASGFSETDRVKEAQVLGAGSYIKKPYTMKAIGMAVKSALLKNP